MYWLAGLSFLAISSAAFSRLFEGQFKDVDIPFTLFVVLHCVLGEIHLTMAGTLQLIQLYFSNSTINQLLVMHLIYTATKEMCDTLKYILCHSIALATSTKLLVSRARPTHKICK